MTEYVPILVFLVLGFAISLGTIFFSLVVGKKNAYHDKNSTYECGFDPFDDARGKEQNAIIGLFESRPGSNLCQGIAEAYILGKRYLSP